MAIELLQDLYLMGEEEEEEEEEGHSGDDSDNLDEPEGDDEILEKIADEMGLDPDEDKELLEKLVKKEKANHAKLSGAIKQKRKWRTEYEKIAKKPDNSGNGKDPKKEDLPDIDKLVDEKLEARLEAMELKNLELPEELKVEVKELAKTKGISVREAANLPYVRYRKEEIEKAERLEKATPKRSKKGTSYTANIDPSKPLDPKDFDLSSEEGRKEWKEAKAARAKYHASN